MGIYLEPKHFGTISSKRSNSMSTIESAQNVRCRRTYFLPATMRQGDNPEVSGCV
jgi:hypothetical protein